MDTNTKGSRNVWELQYPVHYWDAKTRREAVKREVLHVVGDENLCRAAAHVIMELMFFHDYTLAHAHESVTLRYAGTLH